VSILVIELRDNDRMIVNGVPLRFRSKTRVELSTRARFLFGKQIMTPERANTPARRLYLAIQSAYVGAAEERGDSLKEARRLIDEFKRTEISEGEQATLEGVLAAVEGDDCYRALRLLQRVIGE
jgi:flagellar biosynthesis repressor protein FlbT